MDQNRPAHGQHEILIVRNKSRFDQSNSVSYCLGGKKVGFSYTSCFSIQNTDKSYGVKPASTWSLEQVGCSRLTCRLSGGTSASLLRSQPQVHVLRT